MALFHSLRSKAARQFWLAGLMGALALASADAKDLTKEAEGSQGETITVHGIPQEVIRSEIEKMVYAPWYGQLARWDSTFCPLVAGLPERFQDMVLEHLTRTAHAVIPDLPAHCDTKTVFVLFADNGTAAFDEIVAQDPLLGHGDNSGGISRGDLVPPHKEDIEELRKDRPVRWYRSTTTAHASDVTVNGGRTESRGSSYWMSKPTQVRTTSTIVIVDLPLATGATWGQLADYVAFVVLAGPKMGDDFSERSIMGLFDEQHFQKTAPAGLTAFDAAMLHGLYEADPAQAAHDEQGEITQIMLHDLSHSTQAAP
jgi:hypothetical protein